MKIYISGKIGDLDMGAVLAKFRSADEFLTKAGHMVFNPLELHEREDAPIKSPTIWRQYMVNDIAFLFDCDAIYMLPCWQDSPGARVEHAICREMGKKIFYAATEL